MKPERLRPSTNSSLPMSAAKIGWSSGSCSTRSAAKTSGAVSRAPFEKTFDGFLDGAADSTIGGRSVSGTAKTPPSKPQPNIRNEYRRGWSWTMPPAASGTTPPAVTSASGTRKQPSICTVSATQSCRSSGQRTSPIGIAVETLMCRLPAGGNIKGWTSSRSLMLSMPSSAFESAAAGVPTTSRAAIDSNSVRSSSTCSADHDSATSALISDTSWMSLSSSNAPVPNTSLPGPFLTSCTCKGVQTPSSNLCLSLGLLQGWAILKNGSGAFEMIETMLEAFLAFGAALALGAAASSSAFALPSSDLISSKSQPVGSADASSGKEFRPGAGMPNPLTRRHNVSGFGNPVTLPNSKRKTTSLLPSVAVLGREVSNRLEQMLVEDMAANRACFQLVANPS
mmetsp:Transcript_81808/g.162356  ORF Transcript_81808/g.162356 Transcript_81808/m.162356 type:complete len:396 (+) Transcript_81808:4184-5371(+)